MKFLKSFLWDFAIVIAFMMIVTPPSAVTGLWLAALRGACVGIIVILFDGRYEKKEV